MDRGQIWDNTRTGIFIKKTAPRESYGRSLSSMWLMFIFFKRRNLMFDEHNINVCSINEIIVYHVISISVPPGSPPPTTGNGLANNRVVYICIWFDI